MSTELESTNFAGMHCADLDARRALVAADVRLAGIDYLEVRTGPGENQRVLDVHFIARRPPVSSASLEAYLQALATLPQRVRLTGGATAQRVRVTGLSATGHTLTVQVDQPGDFSTYELVIDAGAAAGVRVDPAFASIAFSFKAGCPTRFDCAPRDDCDEPRPPDPAIDYLAKDYRSFRQALLDRLAVTAPGWTDRHEADVGMTLVELLAHAADQLSYQQDAVANEAYLQTARQRVSARRHARLLDYEVFDGSSARVVVAATVGPEPGGPPPPPAAGPPYVVAIKPGDVLLTRQVGEYRRRGIGAVPDDVVLADGAAVLRPAASEVERLLDAGTAFTVAAGVELHSALNDIAIHGWGLGACCLEAGATSIDLVGDLTPQLHPGSLLLLEEFVGVETGIAGDADVTHRQVVRLTAVATFTDPVAGLGGIGAKVTRASWAAPDALRFPLCLSRVDGDGMVHPVARAQGNLLVADHGRRVALDWPAIAPWNGGEPVAGTRPGVRALRFTLEEFPVARWLPEVDAGRPAVDLWSGHCTPSLHLFAERSAADRTKVEVRPDLLDTDARDLAVVPELTNDGRTQLRFGDGVHGSRPPEGGFITGEYAVGCGVAGNIGAGAITHLVFGAERAVDDARDGALALLRSLRNPLPAEGGREPETLAQIKVRAPAAFRTPQQRAVTEADYAEVAMRHPAVADAVARFRWTGSWLTVFLLIDPRNRERLDPRLADDVERFVARYTQAGYDLEVRPPNYVPLDLDLFVCAEGSHFREHVESAVLRALSNRSIGQDRLGFFHPDRFGFGDPLYLSALYDAVCAVPGVASVNARRFARRFDRDPIPSTPVSRANIDAGRIAVGIDEVLELANDPVWPERGSLTVTVGGGR